MSRDRGTASQAVDQGYGLVCDLAGRPIADLIVVGANQEHGIVAPAPGLAARRRPTCRSARGSASCRTTPAPPARQYDRYEVVGPEGWRATWPRFSGLVKRSVQVAVDVVAAALAQVAEHLGDLGMVDRLAQVVADEVLLRDIGDVV